MIVNTISRNEYFDVKQLTRLVVASLFLIIGMLLVTPVEAGKIYTWKDASGMVHYSDKPFPKANEETVLKIQTNSGRKVATEESAVQEPQSNLIPANDAQKVSAACRSARKNLVELLKNDKVIKRKTEDGAEVVLSQTEIQSEAQKNQAYLSSYCKVQPKTNSDQSNPQSLQTPLRSRSTLQERGSEVSEEPGL